MSPATEWIENSDDLKEYQERYPYLYGAVVLTFLLLFGRLWYLQIIKGAELKRFSEQNQIKEEKIEAPRGMILDRNGQILVDSLPDFNAILTPQYIVSLDHVAQDLATVLNTSKDDIIDKVRASKRQNGVFKPVRIKENITRDEVARVERMKIDTPGLAVEMGIKRNYLLGENGAQLFGYTGEISKEELPVLNAAAKNGALNLKAGDIIGKAGLEKRWDSDIRGLDGSRYMVVDARGREIPGGREILGTYPETSDYVPGKNITLTIDKDLQKTAYESFVKDKHIGSIVALDPRSGEILTMINAPSFDPNHFSTGIPPEIWAQLLNDPFKPLRNKVVQDYFPPGSTFKAVVAIAALEEKVINKNSTFFCPGFIKFGRGTYHCWQAHGHGYVSVEEALERSCDVFFYHMGMLLGVDKIAAYARKLGMGARTGIALDNEKSGLIPDTAWKKKTLGEEWQLGENLPVAIGQGFVSVTPLQLVNTYASIGNGGTVYQPYVIKKIEDLEGRVLMDGKSQILHNALVKETPDDVSISPETLRIVKEGLSHVFNEPHGTAHSFRIPGLQMAGKTGTVQLFHESTENFTKCENRELKKRHNAWLLAFAPKDNPQIAVAIHAEHGCHPTAAGPTMHNLVEAYFKKYAPELLGQEDKTTTITTVPAKEEE